MKPCEFEGWVELDLSDFLQPGDVIAGGAYQPPDDASYGCIFGPDHRYFAAHHPSVRCHEHNSLFRYFRRKGVGLIRTKSVHAKPLPLP